MKRTISTIVVIGFVSSMLVNSANAGSRNLEVLNPLWVPVAILSTVAAVIQAPFVRNPFYLDSKSGADWTLNPFSTGQ